MIKWLNISSKAIKGFPMGDPHERSFPVYLPPDYNKNRVDPYPLIYLLAGYPSRGREFLEERSIFTPALPVLLDRAIEEKKIPPVILVIPDGSSKLGCSQYLNSPAFGNYMDYIADELTSLIDETFHTHRSAAFRGIAGHSSGGFGALIMGMLRPDAFQFICSSAGDSFYELLYLPGIRFVIDELENAGGVDNFLNWFLQHPSPTSTGNKKFETMMTLAMAPCFAPNINHGPLLGDLFFDLKTGAIIEEVWEKYLAWDPVRMVDKYLTALRSLKSIHLEAGLQDEYGAQLGHRQISAKLTKAGIPHQMDEYPGGHSGQQWRFISRISLMLEKMSC